MSFFYQNLSFWENRAFKKRKQRFKKNKPCAICGKQYRQEEMMVAHLIPVREISNYQALYDETNWQVRCIYCERRLNREEQLRKRIQKQQVAQSPPLPCYEVQVRDDYDDALAVLVKDTKSRLGNPRKKKEAEWRRMAHAVAMDCGKYALAKGAARVIALTYHVPTFEEIIKRYEDDIITQLKFEFIGER